MPVFNYVHIMQTLGVESSFRSKPVLINKPCFVQRTKQEVRLLSLPWLPCPMTATSASLTAEEVVISSKTLDLTLPSLSIRSCLNLAWTDAQGGDPRQFNSTLPLFLFPTIPVLPRQHTIMSLPGWESSLGNSAIQPSFAPTGIFCHLPGNKTQCWEGVGMSEGHLNNTGETEPV